MSRLEEHLDRLVDPPIEYRPELRWWLAEGLHTDATLRAEVAAAHRLGFGGMEFLAMDEGEIDHSRYGWGSAEWVADSEVVVEETTRRGMSVSFTSGTNWSNANLPTIDPDHPAAAQELDVVHEDLVGGRGRSGPLPRIDLTADRGQSLLPGHRVAPSRQHLVAVVAAPVVTDQGGDAVLDAAGVLDLTAAVRDAELTWQPPDARPWRLFVFWSHGTGQTAAPSVSVNYTVNYLDLAGVEAVIDYWRTTVLTPRLRELIARNPRAQMYMDSLELTVWGAGGMFWGACVAEEFWARRGYDIAPWLPFLVRRVDLMAAATHYPYQPEAADAPTVAKVRHDYVATLTDLYIEHMLRPFAAFLHEVGLELRAEISYGLPFELTRPGPEVDGIETESLEFAAQIDAYRLLAGPAHLFGKQYSAETGATTRNHMLDHRFYDQVIATQLAAGITRTVLHGWASTAGAQGVTRWPGHEGMWPMFAERFDLRQPAAEFYPLWTAALGRAQYLLRQGRPRIDVGILRTDHFVDNLYGLELWRDGVRVPDEEVYAHWWMRDRDNHWWQDLGMQDAGWTYEFLDPSLLLHPEVTLADGVVQPSGPGYQALVVYQEALDADAAARLLDWARAGLPVLVVHGARELKLWATRDYVVHARAGSRTPGLDGRDAELASTMAALCALPTVAEVDDPAATLAALRRLGVVGRAEFVADNQDVLTHLRQDGDLTHLYAYHFGYESGRDTEVEVALAGHGRVSRIDPWTGAARVHDGARREGSRTLVRLALGPGETALLTLDRSAPAVDTRPDPVVELARCAHWQITVESWDAGPDEVLTEDRGDYLTREVRPTTEVTVLRAGGSALAPWTELPGVGHQVSGVGEYRTEMQLEVPAGRRVLVDLGSTCGGLGSLSVNGAPARGFDTSRPVVDVTDLVRSGPNTLVVRVSSSLNNRLIARGYYDQIPDIVALVHGVQAPHATTVRPYGLVGPVRVLAAG